MLGFFIQRIIQAAIVVVVMSILVFVGVYAIGNPIDVMIDPAATQEIRENLIRQYGFDRPLYEQYFVFVGNVLQGDFGQSFIYRVPVLDLIFSRLPATFELALGAMLLASVVGIPLGIWAGIWLTKRIEVPSCSFACAIARRRAGAGSFSFRLA